MVDSGARWGRVSRIGSKLPFRQAGIALISVALAACGAALLIRARAGRDVPTPQAPSDAPIYAAAAPAAPVQNTVTEIQALQRRLRDSPGAVDARVRLAALLDARGLASDAEDVLREALQRGQRSPALFHALGMVYIHNGVYSGAVEAFQAELVFRPKDAAAHLKLAQSYAYALLTDDARREFEKSRQLNPNDPEVYLGLAFVNNGSERYPIAVKYLQEYVKRSPAPGPGYGLLSRVYLNMRKYDDAVKAGQTAAASMPGNGTVWYNLGQAYAYRPGTDSLSRAVDAFEHAARLLPNWGHAHFELGYAYARQNRPAEALTQYRDAVRCEPTHGKYIYELGRMLIRQGQPDDGKREIARAQPLIALNQRESHLNDKLVVAPRDPRVYMELSQVYRKLGDSAQADKCLEAVKALSETSSGIARTLIDSKAGGRNHQALMEPNG